MAEKLGNKQGQKQEAGQDTSKEDYLDKGLDAGEKKFGMSQSRETNEMITDRGRETFEKATGKHVPDKVSN